MKQDAVRGHLDAVILSILEAGPSHGYAMLDRVYHRSGGALDLPTGTLYPALRRLERAGYVSSEWGISQGRRRRTYRLTSAGLQLLESKRSAWQEFSSVIGGLLRPAQW